MELPHGLPETITTTESFWFEVVSESSDSVTLRLTSMLDEKIESLASLPKAHILKDSNRLNIFEGERGELFCFNIEYPDGTIADTLSLSIYPFMSKRSPEQNEFIRLRNQRLAQAATKAVMPPID